MESQSIETLSYLYLGLSELRDLSKNEERYDSKVKGFCCFLEEFTCFGFHFGERFGFLGELFIQRFVYESCIECFSCRIDDSFILLSIPAVVKI